MLAKLHEKNGRKVRECFPSAYAAYAHTRRRKVCTSWVCEVHDTGLHLHVACHFSRCCSAVGSRCTLGRRPTSSCRRRPERRHSAPPRDCDSMTPTTAAHSQPAHVITRRHLVTLETKHSLFTFHTSNARERSTLIKLLLYIETI